MSHEETLTEALQLIHNIYAQDLYCMNDHCGKSETGFECEDCLYVAIKEGLEHMKKEKKNE